jgi:hypothetical protein
MSETLSISIFTIEADSKPLLAFAAKKHQEAVAFYADGLPQLRAGLLSFPVDRLSG